MIHIDLTTMACVISICLCVGSPLPFQKLYECPTTQEMLCENMVTSKGFTYKVPQDMLPDLRDRDCEHGWFYLNETFIVDSTQPGENLGFVVAVTSENLTVSTCINLQWQLHCENIKLHCTVNYRVKHKVPHETLPGNYTSSGDKGDASSPGWLIAVIVGSVIVSVLIIPATIWFCLKKARKSAYTPPGEDESEEEF